MSKLERIKLADAKAHLSALIDRAEAGESIEITRHGKPAARLVPIATPKKPVDVAALKKLTDTLPYQKVSAGEFMRQLRDEERY